ncbi:MAG: hypothetical protein FWB96_08395 [Defluviitaleaceae bacterium]|nr:hypothetical protein [Defluviitaleaceae bacterium]MCL2263415.1 hypothetical protein [Defluviitaleaceae bacterium]
MLLIYDLQEALANVSAGVFAKEGPVLTREEAPSNGRIEIVEDVKTICIYDRDINATGIDIKLDEIPGLMAGDRITVTGRVGTKEPIGNKFWSVALIASFPEDGQITQHTAPDPVFAVSHILEEEQLNLTLHVHTVFWGNFEPLMDFYIDGVLITRREEITETETDTRSTVYYLEAEQDTELMGMEKAEALGKDAPFLFCWGYPTARVFKRGDATALHIGNRFRDWDGIDINIARMKLRVGNQYKITVNGRIDGDAPIGSTIMLQGIPGCVWKCNTPISSDSEFSLSHIMSRTDVEKWSAIRITTNAPGASVPFYIYSIEIVRL